MIRLLGAVLVGGRSRRMGRDKATLLLGDGTPLGRRSVDALRGAVSIDEVVAVGGTPRVAHVLGVPQLPDLDPPVGPLGGVLVALRHAAAVGSPEVVVLPCDLPAVDSVDVDALVARAGDVPGADVVFVEVEGRAQYPIGVWRHDARAVVEAALRAGRKAVVDIATDLTSVALDLGPGFLDADAPGDLEF